MLQLVYFRARGECDKVRLLLAEAGLQYRETLIDGREFNNMKKELEFEQLPLLIDGNMRIVHSNAIARYIARKTGMYGQTLKECASVDMWAEQIEVVQQAFWRSDFMVLECEATKAAVLKKKFYSLYLAPQFSSMSSLMAKNDKAFLVGGKISFVDVNMFSLLDSILAEIPWALQDFPLLQEFHLQIGSRPNIAAFCLSGKRY